MGRRRSNVDIPKNVEVSSDGLAALGLEKGDSVRFQQVPNGNWTYGKASYVDGADSLCIITDRGFRSILFPKIEVKTHGPKGGVAWRALNEHP